MQHRARAVAHLVELVDAADAVVAEHQGAGLQDKLPRLGVLHHVGGQTHGAGALSRRVLAAGHQVVDVLQQLGLAGARVPAQQDVHVGAEVAAARLTEVLAAATKQLQQNTLKAARWDQCFFFSRSSLEFLRGVLCEFWPCFSEEGGADARFMTTSPF